MNLRAEDLASGILRERVKVGASLADVDPMNIDKSVSSVFLEIAFFFFFFFWLFRAAPIAYGHSQARSLIGAISHWPLPQPQPRQIGAVSLTYTTAHGNTRSLTH